MLCNEISMQHEGQGDKISRNNNNINDDDDDDEKDFAVGCSKMYLDDPGLFE